MILHAAQDFIRPLTRRSRPDHIARELEEMSRRPRGVVLQRVREKSPAERLARETLVSLARTFHLKEDKEAVRVVLDALIARVSGALRQKLQGWHVLQADKEDLQRHVIAGLCGCWLNLEPGEELWECNFAKPFELRTITLIAGFFPKRVRTTSLQAVYNDDEGIEKDIADPASEAPFEAMLRNLPERAALRALAGHNAAWSQALHEKYIAGDSEEEIAARHGVSSRTIRNWIKEARQFLFSQIEQAQTNQEDA